MWYGTRLGQMWNESDPLDQYDPCAPSDPECTSSWDADDYPLMGKLLCLLLLSAKPSIAHEYPDAVQR